MKTPGPWYSKPTGCGGQALIIPEADGPTVAVVYDEDNGPLLGAAPELLDALYMALVYVEDALDDKAFKKGVVRKDSQQIRAAIAKAEGRS